MKIILASQSPRRQQFMNELLGEGNFITVPADIPEPFDDNLSIVENAEALALAKAKHVQKDYPEDIIIASDFIAEVDGRLFAKAETAEEAEEMLRFQLGKKQVDVASLAVLSPTKEIVTHGLTELTFKSADDPEVDEIIRNWINSGKWRGYAAAFAIQDETGRLVESIEGTVHNIMGLPVAELAQILKNEFGIETNSVKEISLDGIKTIS